MRYKFTNFRFCSLLFLPRGQLAELIKPAMRDRESTDLSRYMHKDRHWHSACGIQFTAVLRAEDLVTTVFSPVPAQLSSAEKY